MTARRVPAAARGGAPLAGAHRGRAGRLGQRQRARRRRAESDHRHHRPVPGRADLARHRAPRRPGRRRSARLTGRACAELLAELGGPLRDRPAERAALAASLDTAVRAARGQLRCTTRASWYRDWLAELAADGSLTKLVNAGRAGPAGAGGPRAGVPGRARGSPVLLQALAAEVTGDTKALGHGTVLSTLVLRALALRAGAGPAHRRRRTAGICGSQFDVVVDDLASRVLVLDLPAQGRGLGEWLSGAARLGVPFYVDAAAAHVAAGRRSGAPAVSRVREPGRSARGLRRAGLSCSAPLLCTEGRPSTRSTGWPPSSSAAAASSGTTATSTGRAWRSPARSCAVTAPGRGV